MADKQKTGLQAFKIDGAEPHSSQSGCSHIIACVRVGCGVGACLPMEISVCMLVVVCMYVVFLCIKEHLLSVLRALGGAPPCPICPFFLFSSFSFVSHRP